MKSQIRFKRNIIHSDFTFMNSRTEANEISILFADQNSDDTVNFQLEKDEAEKLKLHLESYLSSFSNGG